MASRIVPGGRDSRGTCVRVRAAAAPALPVRSHRPHLAAPPPPARPTPPKAGGHAPRGRWRVRRNKLVHQPRRRHPFGCCPTTSSSPGRRPTSTSYAGPATAPGTVPSPSCSTQVRHAHGHNPEPSAGVIDSCSIKASPVRAPRGFDGAKKIDGIKRHIVVATLGLLVAVLVTAVSVQDRAAVPRLLGRARYRCPPARPSAGRAGLHRQRGAGREQDPAVHNPDRRRDQAQGRLITSLVAGSSSGPSPGCSAADASPASTRRPHWPMRPWSSSASSRSCSAA
jgi:hypothetical protein